MGDGIAGVVAVHQILVEHAPFSSVVDGAKPIAVGGMLTLKEMFLLGQPRQGLEGLVGSGPVPSARQFRSDLAFGHQFLEPEAIGGGSDGDRFSQEIKVSFLFEFFPEFLATDFEEFHVRFAVGFHLSPHDETVIGRDFLGIPPLESSFRFGGHAVGIIVGGVGHGSLVVLVLRRVEFVRKESLTQFLDAEGGRKVGEWEREKTQRVLELHLPRLERQDLGSLGDLIFDYALHLVTVLQEEHPIVPLEVVEDGNDVSIVSILFHAFTPQSVEELGRAVGTVEDFCVVLFVGFGTEEYGSLIPLRIGHGLVIAVDLEKRIIFHLRASVWVIGSRLP